LMPPGDPLVGPLSLSFVLYRNASF